MNRFLYYQPLMFSDICPLCGVYGPLVEERDRETDAVVKTLCETCVERKET